MVRVLQWIVDDERLKPREARERHPIPDDPPRATIEDLVRELHALKCITARLYDQVWWMNLPMWKRLAFRALGFSAPIPRFYLPADGDDHRLPH